MIGELIVYEFAKIFAIIYYRGGCGSRDKEIEEDPKELEGYVYKKEGELGLQSVNFEVFVSAVKRFGYKNDLNDQHLKAISREINLNYPEMFNNDRSAHHTFYHDEGFTFKKQRFHVPSFMLIGFLHCKHNSIES